VQHSKLPPNQWHVVTLTYDGQHSTVYPDGEKIHSKTWSQTWLLPHLSSPVLCIFGCPGGSSFNGFLDDLTLWNRSLSQGEIRAMNYLDRGLNGIVVPRGLFFQSQFFANLNTTSFSYSSPIVGSTAIGNSNPLDLHARTIQQLIAANLTLAAAWTWIEQLTTANDTGNVTAFPLVVTGEVYTLGLDQMVLNVLSNMTVENSGNSTVPPPPIREPTFWESVWNSFTGMLSAAWNAVVAVATFIANVALAVVKWCIDFAVAIANGEGLEFFYETVVKPFVEALLAFIRWVIDLVRAVLEFIFKPITDIFNGFVQSLRASMVSSFFEFQSENPCPEEHAKRAAGFVAALVYGGMMLLFWAFTLVMMTLDVALKPLMILIAAIVTGIALGLILAAVGIAGFSGGYSGLGPTPGEQSGIENCAMGAIPDSLWWTERAAMTFGRFIATLAILGPIQLDLPGLLTAISLVSGIVSVIIFVIATGEPSGSAFKHYATIVSFVLALFSVVFAGLSTYVDSLLSGGWGLKPAIMWALAIGSLGMAYLNLLDAA